MTDDEKRGLAEQLIANPLFSETFDAMEADAIDLLVYADDETRLECALRVRAIRAFREDCEAHLRNDPPRKGAPA